MEVYSQEPPDNEAFVLSVHLSLNEFIENEFKEKLVFPSCLNSKERSYVHNCACNLNLFAKSTMLDGGRHVTVYKKKRTNVVIKDSEYILSSSTQDKIYSLEQTVAGNLKENESSRHIRHLSFVQSDYLNGSPKVPTQLMENKVHTNTYAVDKHLDDIYKIMNSNQVTFIVGDTGSGKTSQIPQHVMRECMKNKKGCYIVCTQSSRIAAASIAQRVAEEHNEEVGNTVGFESKLERVRNDHTLITYCTIQVLLNVLMKDISCNMLKNITHLFIDDVNQRTKLLDVLLVALKYSMKQYPCLRIIFMGYTDESTSFCRLFENIAVYNITNKHVDNEIYMLKDIHNALCDFENVDITKPCEDIIIDDTVNCHFIMRLLKMIHLTLPQGDVLVFLSCFEDVITLTKLMYTCDDIDPSTYKIYLIHKDIQNIDHNELYSESNGVRKILLCVDLMETCVTVRSVMYVVDAGVIRTPVYNSIVNTSTTLMLISKSRMEQRIIKSGHVTPGKYFILQDKTVINNLYAHTIPEICLAPITDICLIVKYLMPHMTVYEFLNETINPPTFSKIQESVSSLIQIEALDANEHLTDIGNIVINFSVEPYLGKILFYSCIFKCLDPILTIVSCLSTNNVFLHSNSNAANFKDNLAGKSYSDHMSILRAFHIWSKVKIGHEDESKIYSCNINEATMETALNIRIKLVSELRAIELIKPHSQGDIRYLNFNSDKWHAVKAALFFGLYPNIAKIDMDKAPILHSSVEPYLKIHPHSNLICGDEKNSLKLLPTDWIMYNQVKDNGMCRYIECGTAITLITIILFGGPLLLSQSAVQTSFNESDSEDDCNNRTHRKRALLQIDNWINVYFREPDHLNMLFDLRQKFVTVVMRKLYNSSATMSSDDDMVIQSIIDIIGDDDKMAKIMSPPRIGHKPHKSLTVYSQTMYGASAKITLSYIPQLYSKLPDFNEKKPAIDIANNLSLTEHDFTKYFLIKTDNFSIQKSQADGIWKTDHNNLKMLIEAFDAGNKISIAFCTEEDVLVFYGFAEIISFTDASRNCMKIKWISNTLLVNDGCAEFLKLLCNKYGKCWKAEINELSMQCGRYLIQLLSKPVGLEYVGRPIQKKTIK